MQNLEDILVQSLGPKGPAKPSRNPFLGFPSMTAPAPGLKKYTTAGARRFSLGPAGKTSKGLTENLKVPAFKSTVSSAIDLDKFKNLSTGDSTKSGSRRPVLSKGSELTGPEVVLPDCPKCSTKCLPVPMKDSLHFYCPRCQKIPKFRRS